LESIDSGIVAGDFVHRLWLDNEQLSSKILTPSKPGYARKSRRTSNNMIRRLFVTAIVMLAVLCGSSFAKDAITIEAIIATFTKEDCEILTALLQRGGTFDEVDAMGKEGKLFVIGGRTRIVVDRVEIGGVLIPRERYFKNVMDQ
jgi:hypothetical protein